MRGAHSICQIWNCLRRNMLLRTLQFVSFVVVESARIAAAQADPSGDVLQLARSPALSRQASPALSAHLHVEDRAFLPTNAILSLGSAPTPLERRNRSGQLF